MKFVGQEVLICRNTQQYKTLPPKNNIFVAAMPSTAPVSVLHLRDWWDSASPAYITLSFVSRIDGFHAARQVLYLNISDHSNHTILSEYAIARSEARIGTVFKNTKFRCRNHLKREGMGKNVTPGFRYFRPHFFVFYKSIFPDTPVERFVHTICVFVRTLGAFAHT